MSVDTNNIVSDTNMDDIKSDVTSITNVTEDNTINSNESDTTIDNIDIEKSVEIATTGFTVRNKLKALDTDVNFIQNEINGLCDMVDMSFDDIKSYFNVNTSADMIEVPYEKIQEFMELKNDVISKNFGDVEDMNDIFMKDLFILIFQHNENMIKYQESVDDLYKELEKIEPVFSEIEKSFENNTSFLKFAIRKSIESPDITDASKLAMQRILNAIDDAYTLNNFTDNCGKKENIIADFKNDEMLVKLKERYDHKAKVLRLPDIINYRPLYPFYKNELLKKIPFLFSFMILRKVAYLKINDMDEVEIGVTSSYYRQLIEYMNMVTGDTFNNEIEANGFVNNVETMLLTFFGDSLNDMVMDNIVLDTSESESVQ